MMFSLLPKFIFEDVSQVSVAFLREQGIRTVLLDYDNTLCAYTQKVPAPAVEQWLDGLQAAGIGLCVVSNSHKCRAVAYCAKRNIPCVTHARKPFPGGIRKSMTLMQAKPDQCLLVGDQIYTDVLGANCAGVRSILVRSIHNHNFWLKARHVLEKPWIFIARKRRMKP